MLCTKAGPPRSSLTKHTAACEQQNDSFWKSQSIIYVVLGSTGRFNTVALTCNCGSLSDLPYRHTLRLCTGQLWKRFPKLSSRLEAPLLSGTFLPKQSHRQEVWRYSLSLSMLSPKTLRNWSPWEITAGQEGYVTAQKTTWWTSYWRKPGFIFVVSVQSHIGRLANSLSERGKCEVLPSRWLCSVPDWSSLRTVL